MINIGFVGSCQLHLCDTFFLNNYIKKKYNIKVKFSIPFYKYDPLYYKEHLDYSIYIYIIIVVSISAKTKITQFFKLYKFNHIYFPSFSLIRYLIFKLPFIEFKLVKFKF